MNDNLSTFLRSWVIAWTGRMGLGGTHWAPSFFLFAMDHPSGALRSA